MGIVIRQGIKTTVLQYLGLGIGLLAYTFLYIRYREVYGLVQVLIDAASLITSFAMLGSNALAVRFYPRVGKGGPAENEGFLTFLLALATVGVALYLLGRPLFDRLLVERLFTNVAAAYKPLLYTVPVLVVLLVYLRVLYQYATNFRLLTVPMFFEQFLFKLALPLLIFGFALGYLDARLVVFGVLGNYALAVLGLVGYLLYMGRFKLRRIGRAVRDQAREMATFGSYGIIGMLGSTLAFRIDTLMVGGLVSLEAAGIYATIRFMTEVVAKPYLSLKQVVAPQVADAWAKDHPESIAPVYKASSLNLLLVSIWMLGGIVLCFPAFTRVAADGDSLWIAFPALLLLGASRIIDAGTSLNEHIILYSPKFRFNFFALLLMAALNVGLNAWLIPRYGISGAALSTLTSIGVFNLSKVVFAGVQFGLWPLDWRQLAVPGLMVLAGVGAFFIPSTGFWLTDFAVKGGVYTAACATLLLWLKPSEEADGIIRAAAAKVGLSL